MRPIILCPNIQKALSQIRFRELKRNSLRYHWIKSFDPDISEINRFTRLMFELIQPPLILEGMLRQHFQNYMNKYPIVVEKIQKDIYVDDLVSGGIKLIEVENLKKKSIELFSK